MGGYHLIISVFTIALLDSQGKEDISMAMNFLTCNSHFMQSYQTLIAHSAGLKH